MEKIREIRRNNRNLRSYCGQVVDMIATYASAPKTLGEMLVPSVDSLTEAYEMGDGLMLADLQDRVVANCTFWELINQPNFGVRLYELGSWIVERDHCHRRMGELTIGEHVAQVLLKKASKRNDGVIATVKRLNSYKGLNRIGAEGISYADIPYITGATCVCPLSSEVNTGSTCDYRRRLGHGESRNGVGHIIDVNYILDTNAGSLKIPCTLMGFNVPRLREIDGLLKHQHIMLGGSAVNTGPITVDTMQSVQLFYRGIGVSK